MECVTADLVDAYEGQVTPCLIQFRQFGRHASFCGPIRTVRTLEDNAQVKSLLSTPGNGAVLVVDGAGSLRTALIGDLIASAAASNGWAGLILFGGVRDSAQLRSLPIGIKALGTVPMKSAKLATGEVDVAISFGGATFHPGHWVYADEDGVLVAATALITA